ncbi:hypothetical protein [Polyangium aurulentum]|uniref:hypothetical protein n=1 Tax=Polyangium aurulentum TaxID=2567896 RepID=UPI0010ADF5AB|nr:hypothetical protein [Polyangium aurulentum]UQA63146.1 hypothetical protein E8A73_022855 [Polyangium aurulentum]
MASTSSTPDRPHLALPYAVLGAAGGWMIADFFRVGALQVDAGLRPALLAVTPLFALVLGLFIHPTTRWPRRAPAFLAAGASVLTAGLAAGGLVGVLVWSRWGVGEGAASGFWCAAAFLPAFAMILAAVRRVGRARRGSLVDRADRRAVWLAVATAVALGTLAALPDWTAFPTGIRPSLEVSRTLGLVAVAAIAALAIGDAAGLVRAWLASRDVRAMRPCAPDDPSLVWARRYVDLGLGDEARASVLSAAGFYREHDKVLSVVRGDPSASRRALAGAVASGMVALAIGASCVLATAARPALATPAPQNAVTTAPAAK